ncbi:MAG: general secretion pathway protein GspB [Thermodesulfobacteriota bacterium]|nr:general secretion pathway protein GspB [Thermodesulfobacteriota bacterium]
MSFILEALKKSENKRSKNGDPKPRTIHELNLHDNRRSRVWIYAGMVFLVVSTTLSFWLFKPWQQPSSSPPMETAVVDRIEQTDTSISQTVLPIFENRTAPVLVVDSKLPLDVDPPLVTKTFPDSHNKKQIYRFGQLPVSIQRQIPPLQMSLHAYNRNDATGSLVQLNGRILHVGDMVNTNISLEQITAEGVVLRYDGYRFLFPRRGS